jgi:hypothetical protein
MLQRSKALAAAAQSAGTEPALFVQTLFRRTLGRDPDAEEAAACADYLRDNSPELLAQVLLMSNELMFVD